MTISEIGKYDSSKALDRALDALDESCKQAFAYHLKQRYDIDTLSDLTLSQIEDAVSDMFGEGATILLKRLYAELRQDTTTPARN